MHMFDILLISDLVSVHVFRDIIIMMREGNWFYSFFTHLENIAYKGNLQTLLSMPVGTLNIYLLVHTMNPNNFKLKKASNGSQIPYLHHSHGGCWEDLLKGCPCFYPSPLGPTNIKIRSVTKIISSDPRAIKGCNSFYSLHVKMYNFNKDVYVYKTAR